MRQMREWSGFFPAAPEYLARFCELMLRDMEELDILGSWLPYEWEVMPMIHGVPRVRLLNLEPYWSSRPWSRALEGKKVLVVHPFAESIMRQYERNRTRIFEKSGGSASFFPGDAGRRPEHGYGDGPFFRLV